MARSGKEFPLAITVKAIDKATGPLGRIASNLESKFSNLHRNVTPGFAKISSGLGGIGTQLRSLSGLVAKTGLAFGGLAVGAGVAFKGMVDQLDNLGDAAERIGIGVDALAGLRFAADQSGASMEDLDSGLGTLNKGMGQLQAGTGRLSGFLKKVSPQLYKQVKGAKSSEEAFGLLAEATTKLQDPTKKAALASAAFGGAGAALVPLLSKGKSGVSALIKEHYRIAGSQEEAAKKAGLFNDTLGKLKVAGDGVKASLVSGLSPAFTDLTNRAAEFLIANRPLIAEWARDFGEKLPARLERLGEIARKVFNGFRAVIEPVAGAVKWFVEKVGGAENAIKLLGGAFLTLQAAKLVGHFASIASGIASVAAAATNAIPKLLAMKAASAAGDSAGTAGGLLAGAGKGSAGKKLLGLGGLGALVYGAFDVASTIDPAIGDVGDQARGFRERFGEEGMDTLPGAYGDALRAEQRQQDRTGRWKARLSHSNVGDRAFGPPRPMAGPPAPEGHVLVEVKAPAGTTVTKDPKSKGISTKNSPQLLPTP